MESESTVNELLSEGLADVGYDVAVTERFDVAAATAQRRSPDVIVLDVSSRWGAGPEAVKQLASIAPVIVVAAHGDEEGARRLLRDGAFAYVTRPFELVRLLALIEAAAVLARPANANSPGG